MPFPSVPPLPPPDPAEGLTNSAPLNVGIGGTVLAASNTYTGTQYGFDVAGAAFATNFVFQFVKSFEKFDQHRWWPAALLLIAIGAALILTHGDWVLALPKAGVVAFQAAMNYAAQKSSGIEIFEPSKRFPGWDKPEV